MGLKDHTGTQSIERAIKLLQIVAARRQSGWRLTDLASHSGLDDSTVLRIMSCLSSLRLVRRGQSDRRYGPGPALYELAVTLPAYYGFQSACHPSLVKIARETGWATRLYLRANNETVLIDRVGATSLQWFNDLGTRRLLLASSQGIAILLALPRQEQRKIMGANREQLGSTIPRRTKSYGKILKRSRDYGFGLSLGDIIPGRASLAVPILTADGSPIAAISVSGAMTEFSESRIQSAARLLRKEARHILIENETTFSELEAQ